MAFAIIPAPYYNAELKEPRDVASVRGHGRTLGLKGSAHRSVHAGSSERDGYSSGFGRTRRYTVATPTAVRIEIPAINIKTMSIKLLGDSPLISHKWSDKAKAMMLDKQMGKAVPKKAPKDPEREYRDSLYEYPTGGYGFPSVAFKAAAVSACRSVEGIRMTEARGAFHIPGELVKLQGEPIMREDMVRIGMGTADIRYRGAFDPWGATVVIRFNENVLTPSQIVNLFNVAGFGVGVGEWRPEKDGSFGMFHVELGGTE